MRLTRSGSIEDRFFERVEMDLVGGCWNWMGTKTPQGYGRIAGKINGDRLVAAGTQMLAHRVSWILHNGPIPIGEGSHGTVVMHKCDNPSCVNPSHLQLGTQADNVKDMVEKGRKVAGAWQTAKGVNHFRSSFKDQSDIDLICATKGSTKELAEKYGVALSTIKRIRRRNGVVVEGAEKYVSKDISQEIIDHIRSTPSGTRGLGKMYGLHNSTIMKIRKGITHKGS